MKTIIKSGAWKILNLFYCNSNNSLYLREISRKIKMNESGVSRYLNIFVDDKILLERADGNTRKFIVNNLELSKIFPLFDFELFEKLPLLRRNAISFYLEKLKRKPLMLVLFGSSAKGTYKEDSDMDVLEIVNSKQDNDEARKFSEAQTGVSLQIFQITLNKFLEELKLKKDKVVQAAVETGFPVFNNKYYYEVVYGRI